MTDTRFADGIRTSFGALGSAPREVHFAFLDLYSKLQLWPAPRGCRASKDHGDASPGCDPKCNAVSFICLDGGQGMTKLIEAIRR